MIARTKETEYQHESGYIHSYLGPVHPARAICTSGRHFLSMPACIRFTISEKK